MLTHIGLIQIASYLIILLLLVKPLGRYMANVYEGNLTLMGRVERILYKISDIDPNYNMDWKHYLAAMLIFNALGLLVVFTIQQLQWYLPFNPQQLKAPSIDLAINTAVSFVTNTNWQAKAPEITFSYFTQMLAFTSQNFLSAATGMCLLIALIRGIEKQERNNLGNFWVDMIRSVLYILLPLSFILALILISQGVIQTLLPNQKIELIQPLTYTHQTETKTLNTQTIPMGPVASQVAIAQLGTNGGGFF